MNWSFFFFFLQDQRSCFNEKKKIIKGVFDKKSYKLADS